MCQVDLMMSEENENACIFVKYLNKKSERIVRSNFED